ncbi:MAG: extracellular solute-binding protein [Paracoccaceae bacterium]|nr:extracellular solute-binding protein [Paracoccaceae bacterium]
MKRRDCLKLFAGAAAGPLMAPALITPARAANRYARFAGKTIVVNWPAHPHYDAAAQFIPEFTKLTGIKVELDKMQYMRMHDKQLLEMSKPQSDYDAIAMLGMWKTEYVKKGLLAPLEPMMANADLADPGYDLQDIVPAYLSNIGMVGGPKGYLPGPGAKLYALPFGTETSIMAYRADILDQYGFAPPQSYAELLAMVGPLHDKAKIGAVTSRGQSGHQTTHAFLLHLNPLGGRVFDDAWNPAFVSEAGIGAVDVLRTFVETGPQGIPSFGFGEMENAFLLGQAAIYIDTIAIIGDVKNPKKSRVDGKVRYALHPKGARYSAESGGFGLAIPARSQNAEAAFLFLQWITSRAQDVAIALGGGVAMRNSTLANPDVLKKYPEYSVLKEQLKHTDPDWRPIIPEWGRIDEQILGVKINEALIGSATSKAALEACVAPIVDVMKQGGYIKA